MPVPVYSKRLISCKDFSGMHGHLNDSGSLWIIKTILLYYGPYEGDSWYLATDYGPVIWHAETDGRLATGHTYFNYGTDLHICWPPGENWSTWSDYGWDFSFHGYELSLP